MSEGSGKIRGMLGRRMTIEEYLALPEDNAHFYALLDGELTVTPAATPRHQEIVGRLLYRLDACADGEVLPRVDVVFDTRNATEPDIVFIRRDRLGIVGEKYIHGAPDLAVEVLSPITREMDLGKKRDLYARCKVPLYWIVDPDAQRIDLLRYDAGEYLLEARVERPGIAEPRAFPGLRLPTEEIFA